MERLNRLIILVSSMAFGCISDVELDLDFSEPKLVADVLISSRDQASVITIGWTYPQGGRYMCDTPLGPFPCDWEESEGPFKVQGIVHLKELESGDSHEYSFQMHERKGLTKIYPEITGIPGHSYSLDIEIDYNGVTSHYRSECYMRATPPIERMSYEIRRSEDGKSDNFVPLIYFTEPQDEKNYYVFQLCQAYEDGATFCDGGSRAWPYSIINDDFLPEHVNGLSIDDGATVAKYAEFYPDADVPGVGAQVKMYSVDRTTYEFYKALLTQFNNDGGAHSPIPASPKSNISGNVIGLFRALDESSGKVYLQ